MKKYQRRGFRGRNSRLENTGSSTETAGINTDAKKEYPMIMNKQFVVGVQLNAPTLIYLNTYDASLIHGRMLESIHDINMSIPGES